MEKLKETVLHVISGYEGKAINGYSYLTTNTAQDFFTLVSIGELRGKHIVDMGLVVRILNEQIIIEHDVNDKPLVDALVQAGIPRDRIVLKYMGESAKYY